MSFDTLAIYAVAYGTSSRECIKTKVAGLCPLPAVFYEKVSGEWVLKDEQSLGYRGDGSFLLRLRTRATNRSLSESQLAAVLPSYHYRRWSNTVLSRYI